MEFLFLTQWANTEALLVLLCVLIIASIYAYDGYDFLKRCASVLFPRIFPKRKDPNLVIHQTEETTPEKVSLVSEGQRDGTNQDEDVSEPVVDHPIFHTEEELENQKREEEEILATETDVITEEDAPEVQKVDEKIQQEELKNTESSLESEIVSDMPLEEAQTEPIIHVEHIEYTEVQDNAIIHEEITREVIELPERADIETEVIEDILEEDISPEEEIIKQEPISQTHKEVSVPAEGEVPKREPSENLYTLISQIKTLIARGQFLDAKSAIVAGLALDKNNRDLNMMLAGLYEQDRQFDKAEYIYKDLAEQNPNDIEILEKLANILIIQKRYEIALALYQRIVELSTETEGNLYIMTHLASELAKDEEKYNYAKRYQKKYPNNPDILTLLAQAEIVLGLRQDAIQTLIKLKNLTPYNHEITEMIAKLVTEEELANNFGN